MASLSRKDVKAIDALDAEVQGKDAPVTLYEYQKRWITDPARFKIGMWSRQAGKSFGTSLEAVDNCCETRTRWVFLSAGERQSKELMAKAQMHAMAYGKACEILESDFELEDKKFKQLEINFPNKSKIIGLPANPSTARGHSANILLDEFAFHQNSRQIWTALFPTVTRGYKIRVISTPQGKKNKFYDLWGNPRYSKHLVTILDAVAQGLILRNEDGSICTPDELRQALGDDEAWAQEYMCEFLDEATAYITYDLINSVEDQTIDPYPGWIEVLLARAKAHHQEYLFTKKEPAWDAFDILRWIPFRELYVGFDVARKRDFSVIWVDDLVEGRLRTAAIINLEKQPFFIQKRMLWSILSLPACRRACIDATGIGAQIAEEAVERFGEWKVEAVDFTTAHKEALAGGLKKNFDDQLSAIPVDRVIRESLHSIKRYPTATGHFRFDADRSEETGHADHFWAKALAVQAWSGSPYQPVEYESVERRRDLDGVADDDDDRGRDRDRGRFAAGGAY
ncbi:MAG: terminase family protein [bacterium]